MLVIVALGAALVAPASGKMLGKISFRQDVLAVKKELRGFKAKAVSSGKPVWLRLDGLAFQVLTPGQEEAKQWPLAVHDDMVMEMAPELLVFSPLGTATPATLSLSRGERQKIIKLDALTGMPM